MANTDHFESQPWVRTQESTFPLGNNIPSSHRTFVVKLDLKFNCFMYRVCSSFIRTELHERNTLSFHF